MKEVDPQTSGQDKASEVSESPPNPLAEVKELEQLLLTTFQTDEEKKHAEFYYLDAPSILGLPPDIYLLSHMIESPDFYDPPYGSDRRLDELAEKGFAHKKEMTPREKHKKVKGRGSKENDFLDCSYKITEQGILAYLEWLRAEVQRRGGTIDVKKVGGPAVKAEVDVETMRGRANRLLRSIFGKSK